MKKATFLLTFLATAMMLIKPSPAKSQNGFVTLFGVDAEKEAEPMTGIKAMKGRIGTLYSVYAPVKFSKNAYEFCVILLDTAGNMLTVDGYPATVFAWTFHSRIYNYIAKGVNDSTEVNQMVVFGPGLDPSSKYKSKSDYAKELDLEEASLKRAVDSLRVMVRFAANDSLKKLYRQKHVLRKKELIALQTENLTAKETFNSYVDSRSDLTMIISWVGTKDSFFKKTAPNIKYGKAWQLPIKKKATESSP